MSVLNSLPLAQEEQATDSGAGAVFLCDIWGTQLSSFSFRCVIAPLLAFRSRGTSGTIRSCRNTRQDACGSPKEAECGVDRQIRLQHQNWRSVLSLVQPMVALVWRQRTPLQSPPAPWLRENDKPVFIRNTRIGLLLQQGLTPRQALAVSQGHQGPYLARILVEMAGIFVNLVKPHAVYIDGESTKLNLPSRNRAEDACWSFLLLFDIGPGISRCCARYCSSHVG